MPRMKGSYADLQPWKTASSAFSHGRPAAARRHINHLVALNTGQTPFSPLLSSCLDVNLSAIDISQVIVQNRQSRARVGIGRPGNRDDKLSSAASANVSSRAETAAANARFLAMRQRAVMGLAETAFAGEVAASASYNSSLAAVHRRNVALAMRNAEHGVANIVQTAHYLVEIGERVALQSLGEEAPRSSKRQKRDHEGMILLRRGPSAEGSTIWVRARSAGESLHVLCLESHDKAAVTGVRRWAEAAGALLERWRDSFVGSRLCRVS